MLKAGNKRIEDQSWEKKHHHFFILFFFKQDNFSGNSSKHFKLSGQNKQHLLE